MKVKSYGKEYFRTEKEIYCKFIQILISPNAESLTRKREESIMYQSTKRKKRGFAFGTATYNERKRFIMATKNTKTRKPMTSRSKGLICLVLLLAVTVFASCLGLVGMNLDAEGVNVLLPWVPVSSGNWVKSLPVTKALGGGTYVEYAYTLPEDASDTALADSTNTIRNRLVQLGETDAAVTVKDNIVRIEMRNMDGSRQASVRNMAIMGGQFEFTDGNGNVVLTEKDIDHADVSVNYNNTRTSYTVALDFVTNKEGAQKLAEAQPSYVAITVDGDSVTSYASVNDGTVRASMGSSNSAYNTAYNIAFLKNYGAVDVTLSMTGSGSVAASSGIVLSVVLIVSAILLVCALVYLIATGKLTGVSAFLSVWCALLLGLFLVATVVVPSSTMLNVGCLVAMLLGLVLAIYAAVTRTDAISKQIGEGNTPKQATKLGFRTVAKNVWIAHGAVLVLSLIMMIFSFSRSTGYTLAAFVFASAVAVLVMRAFQLCFLAITNKASSFGKVK